VPPLRTLKKALTLLGRRLLSLVEVALVDALCGSRLQNTSLRMHGGSPGLGEPRRRPGNGDSYHTAPYF